MRVMPTYTVKLNDRKPVADGTTVFHFEKPSGFMYKPGQFIELTAINPKETDAKGNTRAFSLASAIGRLPDSGDTDARHCVQALLLKNSAGDSVQNRRPIC